MSHGHADALRAGAARSLPSRRRRSARLPVPLRTPDSAARRRPPVLLAAASRPPSLAGGIPNAGGLPPAPGEEAARDRGERRGPRGWQHAGAPRASPLHPANPRLPEVRRDPEGAERAGLLPSPLPLPGLRGGGRGQGGRWEGGQGPRESFFLAIFGGSWGEGGSRKVENREEGRDTPPLPVDGREALDKLPGPRCGRGGSIPLPEFCSQVTLSLGSPEGRCATWGR